MGNLLLAGANQEVLQLECGTAQTVVLLPQDVRLVGYTARHLRKVRVDELARLEYVRMPRRNFPADLPGLARRMPHLRPPSGFSGMSSVAWTLLTSGAGSICQDVHVAATATSQVLQTLHAGKNVHVVQAKLGDLRIIGWMIVRSSHGCVTYDPCHW